MALIQCKNCGKSISDKAGTCPHCGCEYRNASTSKPKNFIFGLILGILGIGAIILTFIISDSNRYLYGGAGSFYGAFMYQKMGFILAIILFFIGLIFLLIAGIIQSKKYKIFSIISYSLVGLVIIAALILSFDRGFVSNEEIAEHETRLMLEWEAEHDQQGMYY